MDHASDHRMVPFSSHGSWIERLRRLPRKEQEVVLKMLDGLLSAAR